MTKEERKQVSAINALAKATEAYKTVSPLCSGFYSIRISPQWCRSDNFKGCGAEIHVDYETLITLADVLGGDIVDQETVYEGSDGKEHHNHYRGFIYNEMWIYSLYNRKGEENNG